MSFKEKLADSHQFYRFLESVPGLLSWTFILAPIFLAKYKPAWVTYFIIVYSVYFVYNGLKFVTFSFIGHRKLLYVIKQNWIKKLDGRYKGQWEEYYYCALLPFASESYDVIKPTIQSIADGNYPQERKILCLSSEKALPKGKDIAEQLAQEFKDHFSYIFVTEHELKPGELKGKAANQNHAGRYVYEEIKKLGIDPAKVMITSNDADMLNHAQYQGYLLYKFLSEGDTKYKRIYQPIPNDSTGLWEANFFSRLIVGLGINLQFSLHQRNNYRRTVYSFYSMNLSTLANINFWETDLIPEDERTMFNALYKFGKDFKVVPLFILASGRPVQGKNKWGSIKEQYIQVRRWAWGSSEFASSVTKALKYSGIPWRTKFPPILNQIRTHVEWTTASILPLFGGIIPLILNENFRETYLAKSFPEILRALMQLSAVGIMIIIYVEWRLVPPRPKDKGKFFKLMTLCQWILLPYVMFLLSSIPALEAQTRLIFNKRIVHIESKKEK